MERLIKRYTNRKLYDTVTSTYVRLDELAALVRAGHDVKVIAQGTDKDMTSYTLALALAKEEEERPTEEARTKLVELLRATQAPPSKSE